MKFVKRQFAKIIDKFWRPRADFDWLQFEYDIMAGSASINEERINVLIAERDKLRKAKKRHSHIQAEIEKLRAEQSRSA